MSKGSIEQRIANLEDKLDKLADIVAEKLQEPKEDITGLT